MRHTFLNQGEVGRDLLAVDWEATPLGALDSWPRSLEAVVRLVLSSRFSMWMAWGPELTFFCNDAYRRDTLGAKYPWALGRPAAEVWSEIWPDIGPRIDSVLTTGVATWDEKLLLFLERSGYTEESYHTFSYSPLAADDGSVAGMLCVVSEDTDEVIADRRMRTLRDLGQHRAGATTVDSSVRASCEALARNSLDLPFTALYLYDADGVTARLAGGSGFADPVPTHPGLPAVVRRGEIDGAWSEAVDGTVQVDLDPAHAWPRGSWPQSPTRVAVVPVVQGTQTAPYGFLVAGLNPFRAVDEAYLDFLELVAGQVAAGVTDARAFELEQQRADTLADLDRAKTEFFTGISHEFRTPLTLMLGPAEDALADRDELLPVHRERLEVIHRNAQRLLKLVNTLLDFSRLETGHAEAQFEPVDLAAYTRELAGMFRDAAQRLDLSLEVDCRELPEPVHVDRELWAKVVLNLVSNALKFTLRGGVTVTLRPVPQSSAVELSVTDTGTGIPLHEQAALFQRFHRVTGREARSHEGSGIGLALVAEVAELHGGEVGVESAPGEGSTFWVRLPLGTAHLSDDQLADPSERGASRQVVEGFLSEVTHLLAAPADEADEPAARPVDDRPRVLVVDDNPDVRAYVARLLTQEYVVETAVDGVDGLERATADPPDLVLTDVMMPRLDGFGLLAALREDPRTVSVPVVMLSARAGEDGMLEGLEAGADDYLTKPFSARELLARVRGSLELDRVRRRQEHLERNRALLDQAQRLAHVGSWEVHLGSGQVRASEEFTRIVGLTEAEVAALGYPALLDVMLHPDDAPVVRALLADLRPGEAVSGEARVRRPDGEQILVSAHVQVLRGEAGEPALLQGSIQDISERRRVEEAVARARADAEAAAREHAIADALQRSLLPESRYDLEHLHVTGFYQAGVEGTQVGGDWYDVIELGGGRTALVIGDVMGRGVQAAAVMGQLRAAVRAYARLDLPPADLLESLDGIVRELGDDQIVTCVYAVFDPADHSLRWANAGHLPPLVIDPVDGAMFLSAAEEPPLGVGPYTLHPHEVRLPADAAVVLYTDGLVERRGEDLDEGLRVLRDLASDLDVRALDAPQQLVHGRLPEGPDDDVAVLVAALGEAEATVRLAHTYDGSEGAVADARRRVRDLLREQGIGEAVADDAVLVTSELVTNAVVHAAGRPCELRVDLDERELRIEVHDQARYEPRKQRPDHEDEHGRGLQIVSTLAQRWGTRPTEAGKAVWCILALR